MWLEHSQLQTLRMIGRLHLATPCQQTAAVSRRSLMLTQPADMLSGTEAIPREHPLACHNMHWFHHVTLSTKCCWSCKEPRLLTGGWVIRPLRTYPHSEELLQSWDIENSHFVFVTNFVSVFLHNFWFKNISSFFQHRSWTFEYSTVISEQGRLFLCARWVVKWWTWCDCVMTDT